MKLNKEEIIESAKLSNLSYLTKKQLEEIYNTRPLKKENSYLYDIIELPYFYMTLKDCQFNISEFEDKIVIAFRGTFSATDILTDLNFFKERIFLENYLYLSNFLYVHSGFYNQFNSARGVLNYKIKSCVEKNKPIIFTGHSLGGAVATIGSLIYSYKFFNYDISCITFGSPRVGCHSFADVFDRKIENSLRFVNDNDPVPCIPSAISYKHVKKCMWINGDKIDSDITVYRGLKFLKNTFLHSFGYGYDAMKDHSCISYIKDLENIEDLESSELDIQLEDIEEDSVLYL